MPGLITVQGPFIYEKMIKKETRSSLLWKIHGKKLPLMVPIKWQSGGK